jgi:CBS domain-containing protein
MRKHFNTVSHQTSIDSSINTLIKYKVNGLLTVDDSGSPIGVVSKTDIIGAYYAGLPIDSPLEYIMARPPLLCSMNAPLEQALEQMRESSVYRLYVTHDDGGIVGSLAYPDIVGLLYRSCFDCEYSHFSQHKSINKDTVKRLVVSDVAADEVKSLYENESLSIILEEISSYRFGAILITDEDNNPSGVISKTDLILAYKHGVALNVPASSIMSHPVQTCSSDELLEQALRRMIFSDIHRLFVSNGNEDRVTGVFSLTDAARARSGSCHACVSSRITIEN